MLLDPGRVCRGGRQPAECRPGVRHSQGRQL